MILRAATCVSMLLGAVATALAQAPTATLVDPPAELVIGDLPNVLDDDAVGRHLDTGLTSTLIVSARVRGASAPSFGATLQIDVRYDLWDEVYRIAETVNGGETRSWVASPQELAEWWSGLRLEIPAPTTERERPLEVDVSLSLVPFSEAEREDTELWFSRAAQRAETGVQPADPSPGGGLGGLLELVMTSSIRREELLRYDWRVVVTSGPDPSRERDER